MSGEPTPIDLALGPAKPNIWFYEDTNHSMTLESAIDGFYEGKFKKTHANFNFGFNDSTYWIHFDVKISGTDNSQPRKDILIASNYPHTDFADLYRVQVNGDIKALGTFGDAVPFGIRAIDSNIFLIPDNLATNKTYHYWLKLNTKSSKQLHISIWNKDKYLEKNSHLQLAYGAYFGVLAVMAIYNFFLGFSIRDRSYFHYVGYILCFGTLQGCLWGYSYQYVWPNMPAINNYAISSLILFSVFFACTFARNFLQTSQYSPKFDIVLKIVALLCILAVIIGFFLTYRQRVTVAVWGSLVGTVALLSVAISMYINGHRFAQFFLAAWTVLLVGAVTYGFTSLGFFPINIFTKYSAQFGSALEVILLSFALADRINRIKAEKREFEKQAKLDLESKNTELKDTLDLLQRSNSLKDEFLATISHELRTPMNGIEGSLQIVQQSTQDQTLTKHLAAASHSANHMTQLVESLLEYSELQSGNWKLNERAFILEALINKCTDLIKGENVSEDINFRVKGDFKIGHALIGDLDRIQHLTFQLLDNAFKFTHKGNVTLEVTAEEQADQYHVSLTVSDSGIGIPPNQLKVIFEGFRQADGSFSRQYGGLGIGLSLCKAIVDKMQGSISVESLPNQGTTFSIEIDLAKGEKIQQQPSQQSPRELPGGLKVLVVEDNPVNQMTLVAIVKKLGCQVDKANNGEEAVRLASDTQFDCILMDCQMPIMDGFDATRVIRSQDNPNKHVPIIAVTANAMSGDKDRCIEAGMDDYIRKPIKVDTISERLFHWLIDKAA